jgi:hypothetical protein
LPRWPEPVERGGAARVVGGLGVVGLLGHRFGYEIAEAPTRNGAAETIVFSRFPILHTEALPAAIAHRNWLVTLASFR